MSVITRLLNSTRSSSIDTTFSTALSSLWGWLLRGIFIVSTVIAMPIAHAVGFDKCTEHFYAGTPPDYLELSLTKETYIFCKNGFANLYSGKTLTGIWSATRLTRERLAKAENVPREDNFHEERDVLNKHRASLNDYVGSGYDRGHIAPSAVMSTRAEQNDSFSLANIAPQSPRNNRYVWRNIEAATRALTRQYGEVYVVTGVNFTNKRPKKIGGRVSIPDYFFKAVYIPAIGQAGVYYAPNDESDIVYIISVDDLALKTGIDVMPAINPIAKSHAYEDLPKKASDVKDEASSDSKKKEKEMTEEELIQIIKAFIQLFEEILLWFLSLLPQ